MGLEKRLKNDIKCLSRFIKDTKEILELGMYCKKFNITKAELQDLASKKRYEEEKEEHDRRTKGRC